MDRMTDEQFEECLAQIEGTTLPLSDDDSKPFVAKVRRLRELERAAEAVWQEFKAGRAFACDARKRRITREALDTIAAIGRLLEEPKDDQKR